MKVNTTPFHIYFQIKKIQGHLPIDLRVVWSDRFSKWKYIMAIYHAFHLLVFHKGRIRTGMNEMCVCVCTFYIIHLYTLKDPLVKTTNVDSFVTVFFFLNILYISVCVYVYMYYICVHMYTNIHSTFDIHRILWHIWVQDETNMTNWCVLPEENRTVCLHQTAVGRQNV